MSAERRPHRLAISFVAGLVFAIGLGVAGMTDPAKVANFLDVFGTWDPSLAFVMGGAILVYAPVARLLGAKEAPRFDAQFHWPTKTDVDPKLLVGATLFGVGWGLAGFCPGPAIVVTTRGTANELVFFAAMLAGMGLFTLVTRRKDEPPPKPTDG